MALEESTATSAMQRSVASFTFHGDSLTVDHQNLICNKICISDKSRGFAGQVTSDGSFSHERGVLGDGTLVA
jgi:hypothetical protein